jgi:uncharacterized protein YozE (UPF0346 family)
MKGFEIMESYYNWAVRKYQHLDSERGDFVRRLKQEKRFPKNETDYHMITAWLAKEGVADNEFRIAKNIYKSYRRAVLDKVERNEIK